MASPVSFNVNPTFDLDAFVKKLADSLAASGYSVKAVKLADMYSIDVEKDLGGINTILGLGEGIKANVVQNGNTVTISYLNEEWTSKIIAIALGWVLSGTVIFLVTLITGIVGLVKQLDLPKKISNEAMSIAATL
ncbi:MAG: hypothetical protein IJ408_06660 [Clostridia bacterium]|nr:hypothetical protein [Clostridia bacterium]